MVGRNDNEGSILSKRLSRREALSTAGKIAISVVVTGVVAGVGGYLAGSAAAPAKEVTKTVTSTVGAPGATVTTTVTAGEVTKTVTQAVTRTVTAGAPPTAVTPEITITFASPEWLPGRLTGLIAEKFPEWSARVLGKAVAVKMDLIPWGVIHDRITTTLAAKSKEPTLLISDSQWLGELFVGGHILRLNPLIEKDPELQQLVARFDESLVNYYMTYPQGNRNNIVGFAHEGDVITLVYRTDLFRNPTERENFKAQFGYDLPQKYEDWWAIDWVQVRDMAKFFTRKAGDELAGKRLEEDFYGIAVHMSKEYDALACLFGTILYCWGEYWWDPVTGQVEGIVNSERAVKALEFYRSLVPYSPPNYLELWFDQCNAVMQAGRVAMITNWVGFQPSLFDPAASKVYDRIECAVLPGHRGDDGIFRRYANIGGQPMCINAYSDYPDIALAFIKFWFEPEQQRMWAEGGGGVCLKDIIATDWFKTLTPYNRAYADSIPFQLDFWNVPTYAELLMALQEEIHACLAGQIDPKTALDRLAKRHREIIEEDGYPDRYPPEFRYPADVKSPLDVVRAGEPASEVGKPKKK